MSCAQCRRLLNPEFGGFTTSQPLEDILSSLKDQEERTISREALLTQLLSVTNASKQSLWSQIKEFTGWKNSKTEIDEGSFRYKIVY